MPATTLTFQAPTNSVPLSNPVATDPTNGNKWLISDVTKTYLFVFVNGHSSPITITCAGVAKAITVPPYGAVTATAADATAAVANATTGTFKFTPAAVSGYLDVDGYLTFTYTSGNVALKVLALSI